MANSSLRESLFVKNDTDRPRQNGDRNTCTFHYRLTTPSSARDVVRDDERTLMLFRVNERMLIRLAIFMTTVSEPYRLAIVSRACMRIFASIQRVGPGRRAAFATNSAFVAAPTYHSTRVDRLTSRESVTCEKRRTHLQMPTEWLALVWGNFLQSIQSKDRQHHGPAPNISVSTFRGRAASVSIDGRTAQRLTKSGMLAPARTLCKSETLKASVIPSGRSKTPMARRSWR